MAIEGLPNPQIHRMCKRCRTWFNAHEGDHCWPPKIGLLTWVHVTVAESVDQDKELKFYCKACQQLNNEDETRFAKNLKKTVITIVVVALLGLIAWALGLTDMLTSSLRGR